MIELHRFPPALLAELSSGVCSASSLRLLRAGQLSRHLLLIRHIADAAPRDARCEDALAALDSARARDPVAASRVLSDPMAGSWLAQTVRQLRSVSDSPADLGQLAALAAATAARCEVDVDLTMDQHGPAAMIPTMGLLPGCASGPLRLRVRDGSLMVTDGVRTMRAPPGRSFEAGRWLSLRRLTSSPAEPTATLTLDDISPSRDIYDAPPQHRVHDDDMACWQQLFAGAWHLLSCHASDIAAEIGRILRTIVPLRMDESCILRSATARQAFGALGTTRPKSRTGLAVTLAHEARHSVLNALMQLEPLFDRDDPAEYFAPWRKDARPIWGLFHGVYAFLAVADVTNQLRAEPAEESAAEREFAKVRGQLRLGMESLLGAPSLTESGRHFAAGMEKSLTRLEAVPVSRSAADSAARALNHDRARWQQRNGRAE